MRNHFHCCALLLFGLFISPMLLTGQTAGTPDPNFGQAGQAAIEDPINIYYGGPTVLLPNGKLITGAVEYDQNSENGMIVITRLLPDGSFDLAYGTNGQSRPAISLGFDGGLSKIALTADGKLIAVGNIVTDTEAKAFIARIDANGELDPSFGQNGLAIFDIGDDVDEFWCVLIKSDGKILAGGSTLDSDNPGFFDLLLAQLLPDGTLDPAFGADGIATADFTTGLEAILSLSLQADGKIVAVGGSQVNDYNMEVVRFLPNGAVDPSFASNGVFRFGTPLREDVAYAGAVQADQKIVFCGTSFQNAGNAGETTLFRLNPDGTFDPSFGTNGQVFTDLSAFDFARALVLQPDGKILVGAESIAPPVSSIEGWFWVLRYNTDGSLDGTFGSGGKVQSPSYPEFPETADILLQPDGKIIQTGTVEGKIILWRYLNDIMVGIDAIPTADFQLQFAPNPLAEYGNLNWQLEAPGEVRCDLYDAQGRLLQTLIPSTFFPAGRHQQTLHLGNEIPSGACFLEFTAGVQRQVINLIKR